MLTVSIPHATALTPQFSYSEAYEARNCSGCHVQFAPPASQRSCLLCVIVVCQPAGQSRHVESRRRTETSAVAQRIHFHELPYYLDLTSPPSLLLSPVSGFLCLPQHWERTVSLVGVGFTAIPLAESIEFLSRNLQKLVPRLLSSSQSDTVCYGRFQTTCVRSGSRPTSCFA